MDSFKSKLQSIELKVKKLSLLLEQYENDHALINEENLRLKESLAKYEDVSSKSSTQIFEETVALPPREEKKIVSNAAIKAKVNGYIKEIDKCIELVNNW